MKKILFLIVLVFCSCSFLLAEIIYVPSQFSTIQEAINYAFSLTGSVTILVYDGNYDKFEIVDCPPEVTDLTIESLNGYENCFIDGNQDGTRITIDNSNYITIQGFTIQNAGPSGDDVGHGLFIDDCFNCSIDNCHVINNTSDESGGGIYSSESDVTVNNCIIKDNYAESVGGGIASYLGTISVLDCEIKNNETSMSGGGIGAQIQLGYQGVVSITNTVIKANEAHYGGGIWIANWMGATTFTVDIDLCLISDNQALYHGGGIYFGGNEITVNINKTTISNNFADVFGGGIYCSLSSEIDLIINSCIIWDNTPNSISHYIANIQVDYSDIEGVWPGIGNINEDPLFTDPGNGFYYLQWNEQHISPCIDAGDPTIIDPDGTPSDMGAFRTVDHDYHLTTAQHDRYRYRSLPVIDRDYVLQGFVTTYICAPVEDQTLYFKIFDQYENYQEWIFETQSWSSINPLETLDSVEGYKLKTTNDVEIPTSGRTLSEDTRVYLDEGENWVGYFIGESMTLQDAFAEIWDHLRAVYSEDWAWVSPGIPHERSTLLYGKMYIVYVDEACDFVYGNGTPEPPKEREMTEGFYYVETPTYSPINILNLDDPTVLEVGVFLDGECIGATQVEEFPLQILAFPAEGSRGSGEITFEFYYGGRSYRSANDYKVLNKETGQFVNSKIELRPYEFTTICFGNPPTSKIFILSGNYPNPFNPTTTISYSIPSDGNIELIVYNIRGQKIKTLISGTQPTGVYNVIWNGKDENDRSVSSGIYLYKLNSSGKTAVKKMLLLK